jgi:ketosteroid isomerase-like protein
MSQENMEVVRLNIEAFNRRDLRTWLATFRSDGEMDWSRSRGPLKGVYRGLAELEVFWNGWLTFDWGELETYDLAEAGSEVVVPNTATFRGRGGIEVVARSAFVFTIEDGQIVRQRMFQVQDEALEAVGLSE